MSKPVGEGAGRGRPGSDRPRLKSPPGGVGTVRLSWLRRGPVSRLCTGLRQHRTRSGCGQRGNRGVPDAGGDARASTSTHSCRRPAGSCRTTAPSTSPRPPRRPVAGVAVREFPLSPATASPTTCCSSTAQAVGVLEAKKVGTSLIGVETQSGKYADGPARRHHLRRCGRCRSPTSPPAPRPGSPTGSTRCPRSREVHWFHRPETLARWVQRLARRSRHRHLPRRAAAPAAAGPRRAAPGAVRRDPRASRRRWRADRPPRADPDGHRRRQDVHAPPPRPTGC